MRLPSNVIAYVKVIAIIITPIVKNRNEIRASNI